MHRRPVLVGAAVILAGCSAWRGGNPADEGRPTTTAGPTPVDDVTLPGCETADRPTPAEGYLEPRPYPERPASLSNDTAVRRYVEAYEEAYVHNRLLEGSGDDLRDASVSAWGTSVHEGPNGSRIVSIRSSSDWTFERGTEEVHGSGMGIRYVYYVDATTVVRVRAEETDGDEDTVDPSALEDGTVLECTD